MDNIQLSLVHVARQPNQSSEQPPLLLLLHGYGANERDLFGFAPYVDPRFLVVSARAPRTVMQGMFAWFDINWTNRGISIDRAQAERARDDLIRFVEEAAAAYHADPACIYLLGFSQGAIMSAAVALKRPDLVAGVVLMSGSVTPELIPNDVDHSALTGKPFLVTHGTYDTVLPIQNGHTSRDLLHQLPVNLVYKEYPIGHEVSTAELADVTAWLKERLE